MLGANDCTQPFWEYLCKPINSVVPAEKRESDSTKLLCAGYRRVKDISLFPHNAIQQTRKRVGTT